MSFLASSARWVPCHPHLKKRQLRNGEILEVSLYYAAGMRQTWFSDAGSLVLEPGSYIAPYRPLSKTVHTPLPQAMLKLSDRTSLHNYLITIRSSLQGSLYRYISLDLTTCFIPFFKNLLFMYKISPLEADLTN